MKFHLPFIINIFLGALLFGSIFFNNQQIVFAESGAIIKATTKISVCGNGIKEIGEQCDGSDFGGASCNYLGFDGGTLKCSPACEYNTSSCTTTAEQTATLLFSSNIGGSYTLVNGGNSCKISLPADFYSDDLRLQMFIFDKGAIQSSSPAPSGKDFVEKICSLKFIDSNGNTVSTLSKPATITLTHTVMDTNGINNNTLAPYQTEINSSIWHAISSYTINTMDKTIAFSTISSNMFAIFGLSTPPPPPPSGGGGGTIPVTTNNMTMVTTGVTIQGKAYPLSKIVLLKDAQQVAQTIAGSNANFSFNLTGLTPGTYTFSLYAQDKNDLHPPLFSFSLMIQKGIVANVGSIFLAPTLGTNKTEVRQGGTITFFGQTTPKSTVTVIVHSSHPLIGQVLSGTDGTYVYDVDTSALALGIHSAKSKTTLISKLISGTSQSVAFTVGNKMVTTPSKANALKVDINRDERINIVDFSILAYWYGRTDFPPRMDLNGDGKIDLVDFSIMAYYWTG